MGLIKKLKQKIDAYFGGESEEEIYEILEGYWSKEKKTYTLEEFKSEVEKFGEYLMNVSIRQDTKIEVKFSFEPDSVFTGKSRCGIKSEIFIRNKDW